jgi:hypothetical protein
MIVNQVEGKKLARKSAVAESVAVARVSRWRASISRSKLDQTGWISTWAKLQEVKI